MNPTKEQRLEKDKKIASAISKIKKSGKPTTVKLIAELTGYQVYDLYNQPAIRELMAQPNASYRYILNMGYSLNVKLGRSNTATLHLFRDGAKEPCHSIGFAPNGKLSRELVAYMPTARPGTSVDAALKQAAHWVKKECLAHV